MIRLEGLSKNFGAYALYSGAGWLALNLVAFILPWQLGRRALENHE